MRFRLLQVGEQVEDIQRLINGDFLSLTPSMSPSKNRRRRKKKNNKKKKKHPPTPQSTLDPSLPHDLLLSCIARVSRLYYPTLSLVSKSFRSFLSSPELYKARSLLGHTEICLYVCLYSYFDQSPKWFTLCRKPNQTLTNDNSKTKKPSGYVLARALIPHSRVNSSGQGLVAFGSSIYNIGRSIFSSSVSILDCTTHTWREAPNFRVKLSSLTACVVDRKIYVAGCYDDGDDPGSCKNSIEVFDTETKIWDSVPVPCSERNYNFYYKSACIDGKFQLKTETEVVAYNSKEGRWDVVRPWMCYLSCVIENVSYSCNSNKVFRWFDTEASVWRKLKGLGGLPELPWWDCVRLADYGGNMVVFWQVNFPYQEMIWCAEIALKRHNNCEIWGEVKWFDIMLVVPVGYNLVNVHAVTV